MERGEWSEALKHAEEDLRLDPDRPISLMRVAWLLTTHASPEERAPERAIELAKRADELTQHKAPRALDTLASAYAASGRFDEAARVVSDLLELELATGGGRADVIRERLARYQAAAVVDTKGLSTGAPPTF